MAKPLLVFFLILSPTQSFGLTGKDLLGQCSAPINSLERHKCNSYVLGVVSGANMIMASLKQIRGGPHGLPMMFCAPPTTPTNKLVSATIDYLKEHPEGLRYDAASEVLLAVASTFPCSNAGS